VKLGGEKLIDAGATSLRKFVDVVDTTKTGAPSVLGVICVSGYVREDGIAVIPIRSIAP
jgi:hypothetical protein